MPQKKGFIIVGGGILGAATAYSLARGGARVTLLEAREPGAGASGGSFAWINATSKSPREYFELNRRGLEAYEHLSTDLGLSVAMSHGGSLPPIGLSGGGSLHLAVEDAERAALWTRFEALYDWGYPVVWLEGEAVRTLEPALQLPSRAVAAMHARSDGWVDPPLLLAALLQAAQGCGARIECRRPVIGLRAVEGKIRAVLTAEGELEADGVVLAAGTAVPELAASVGVTVAVERSPGLLALTSPVETGGPGRVVYVPGVHARPAAGGRLLLGASDLDERVAEGMSMSPVPEWADVLRARIAEWYPRVAASATESAHVCVRPMPADGFPIVGAAPGLDGLYLAVTHSGITLGPLLGDAIAAELFSGQRLPMLDPYRPERFKTGPA